MPYDISIELEVESGDYDLDALRELAIKVMTGEEIEEGTGLAIVITDDESIRELNRDFLGTDAPTDVLSFPDESADDDFIEGEPSALMLGDIAISLPTAQRQAANIGHSLQAELSHLLTHGILHLCGYDHVNSAEEEAEMRAREEVYLGDLSHAHKHEGHG